MVNGTKVDFYCKKCKKSTGVSYNISGNNDASVAVGIIMRCPTHKCMRTITFKKITEGNIIDHVDSNGKMFV